jgi:hypothetical protein
LSRHRHRFLLLALCCLLGSSGASRAAILSSVKQASPINAENSAIIAKSITDQVGKMTGQDSSAVGTARQTLIDDADTPAGGASIDYQKQYVATLAKALTPLLGQNKKDQRNAAIVIGGLAAKVDRNNIADLLAPQVKTMLASNDILVAYWGVKTAKYVVASTVTNTGKDGGLGKLIIDEVQKADTYGVLVEEAYQGLTLEIRGNNGPFANITMPLVMDLLEWRISLYKVGTPPNPQAEKIATGFLTFQAWNALAANPQQRDRAMKDIGDLACNQLHALVPGYDGELGDAAGATANSIGALALHFDKDPDFISAAAVFKLVGPQQDPSKLEAGCQTIKAAFAKHNIQLSAP